MWTKEIEREQVLDAVDEVDDFIDRTAPAVENAGRTPAPVRLREDQRNRLLTRVLEEVTIPTIPEGKFPGLDIRSVTAISRLRRIIGSDFCDVFRLPGGSTAVILGEIVGSSGIVPLQIPQIKFGMRALLVESSSASRALTAINRWMCAERASARAIRAFARLAVVVFDHQSDWVDVSVAGAESPIVVTGFGCVGAVDIVGLPLGIDADYLYDSAAFRQGIGDTLVMTTNGITNARHNGVLLGYEGAKALIQSGAKLADSEYGVARYVMEGAVAYAGGELGDNATVVSVQRVAAE